MIECSQCLASVFEEDAEDRCPFCGADLPQRMQGGAASGAPAPEREDAAPADEPSRLFRRQFEERGAQVPEQALRRAEEILRSAETESRRATILLVDLVGFSLEGRVAQPEDLSRWARSFYDMVTGFTMRRGGFVVKFLGDAVLSVFGAPVAYDRDTESAVWAALDIRDWCRTAPHSGRPMQVSIGLATGALQSGRIQGPSGEMFDVMGDTVNLAARLQAAAGTNEILVCQTTQRIAQNWFEFAATAPLVLKNISDSYTAWRVEGEKESPAPRRSFETPFRGRTEEIAALRAFLAEAPPMQMRVAHICGEAGLGKTRLIREALSGMDQPPRAVWWEASPAGAAVLLYPVLHWLRAEIGLGPRRDARDAAAAIEAYLRMRLPGEDANPLLLGYLFGLPEAIEGLRGIPPERIQKNLFGLLRRLLLAEGPALVVADDFQWFDPLTLDFLRQMMDWPLESDESIHLSLAAAYRNVNEPPIVPRAGDLALSLDPLGDEERGALLDVLTPARDFLPELRKLILAKAAGNPLFLEEMTRVIERAMREEDALNSHALKNRIVELIPATLRELIQSRIDRLDARTRQTLQCASLLGDDFAFSLIEMFDIIRDGLVGRLQSLLALRYLEERPAPRELTYFFTHGLFRDVAYSTLLEEQKQRLHGALARRLEEAFADRIAEYCELLAYHFERAGESERALYYLVKAADRQAGLGGGGTALANYHEAIELLRGLPPTAARRTLMARVLIRCARIYRGLGRQDESDEALEMALECAADLDNERLALEARLEQSIGMAQRGRIGEAVSALGGVVAKARELRSWLAELAALNALEVAAARQGRDEEALQAFRDLARLAEARGSRLHQADAFNNAGMIYWQWGQYSEALRAFKRGLPARRDLMDHFGLAAALMNIGAAQEQRGTIAAALRSYESALAMSNKIGYVQGIAATLINRSNLLRRLGRAAEAQECAAKAALFARQASDPTAEAVAELNAGEACLARGDFDGAFECLERAAAMAKSANAAEVQTDIRVAQLDARIEAGLAGREAIGEINTLFETAEKNRFENARAKLYRLKARLLTVLGESNRWTAREYLEIGIEHARAAGRFFDELDCWREMRRLAESQGDSEHAGRCAERCAEMEASIARQTATDSE